MGWQFRYAGQRRRLILIVLGVALALAAGWGAFMLAQSGAQQAPVATGDVLVAARDIQARWQITADDVTVARVPLTEILEQSYTTPTEVIGRVTAVPVYTDQQMTPNLFATTAADAEFSILGPDEEVTETSPFWRAVSVSVPAERAVGGLLKDDQRVDLFVSVDFRIVALDEEGNFQVVETATQEGLEPGKSTKIVFQDLRVLKADTENGIYTLKVDLHQAEEISHVIQVAPDAFTLVLRPDEDTRTANALEFGETNDAVIMDYLFRVPRLIDLEELLGIPIAPVPAPSPEPGEPTPAPGEPTPAPEESPAPAS